MMGNKIISDIRVYKSTVPNVDGNPLPEDIDNRPLHIALHRIAMKLRENEFSLGDYDHLYLNFTTCRQSGEISPAERSKDPYHPWYRYYDIGVDEAFWDSLEKEDGLDGIIRTVAHALTKAAHFVPEANELINACVDLAVGQKEQMLMQFKIKETEKRKAVVYLRYLDSGEYFPLLCVYDADGHILLRRDLEVCRELSAFGRMRLSGRRVTILPRENAFSCHLEPITFEY